MEKLREARGEKGMSQMEVARKIDVHINTYRRYEHGVSNPGEDNRRKLEEVLDIELN